MQAKTEDIAALLGMQQIDLELMRETKRYEQLPQRKTILEVREKKRAIEQKRDALEQMRVEADRKLTRLGDEDASLAEKQRRVQAEIDECRGDYRSVETRTKELNGLAKRRNVLEEEMSSAGDELTKVEGVQAQVTAALETLERNEAAATRSFQKEGMACKEAIARLEAQRAPLAASLSTELLEAYDRASVRSGGVAVARLKEGRCGACRAVIDGGRLIDIKAQAPLATCPSCKRLLVVE